MSQPQICTLYRPALLLGNCIWRISLFLIERASLRSSADVVLLLLWPSVPYLLLAWLVGVIKTPWVLYGITVIVLGTDVLNGVAMLHPTGSTAGLAAVFLPLWQITVFLPGAIVLDWFIRWRHAGFRIRGKDRRLEEELDDDETEERSDE